MNINLFIRDISDPSFWLYRPLTAGLVSGSRASQPEYCGLFTDCAGCGYRQPERHQYYR